MKPVMLSKRLQAVVSMVTAGNRICDVGCDHGFVSIYLIEQKISPGVLAMDVRSGPLSAAKEHIAERGLNEKIETRISDGLHNYNIGEADTLICAGMGGRLMMRILSDDKTKTESFREMILQPQSEIESFRAWLRRQGYYITDEIMIEEDDKFYPMMRVMAVGAVSDGEVSQDKLDLCKPCSAKVELCKLYDDEELCKLADRYGLLLLQKKDRTLAEFLRREERIYQEILTGLCANGLSDEKREIRYAEVSELLADCRKAMEIVLLDEKD
ncbi:MAG: class I SAM-dependent methyltransferase [Lachnospiraceae bacterium]|nr:class I SAM-dependent methyltransferase [Lachnospiraceae bacterium]